MANYLLGLLKFRRGTSEERKQVIFEEAEPVIDLTQKELYIGDGMTPGGFPVGYRTTVVNQTESLTAGSMDYNQYIRFSGTDLTYTFSGNVEYEIGREYHGRNSGESYLTIVASDGFIINTPTEGGLSVPPGGTFTVKIVDTDEADLFGITETL